jgi:G3E family GTPase
MKTTLANTKIAYQIACAKRILLMKLDIAFQATTVKNTSSNAEIPPAANVEDSGHEKRCGPKPWCANAAKR